MFPVVYTLGLGCEDVEGPRTNGQAQTHDHRINTEGCKTEQNVMNGRRGLVWKREVDVGRRRELGEGDGVPVTRMLLV